MNTKTTYNFGKYLRSIREKNNLTQVEVSEKASVAVRHYQDIEYGHIKCRIDTLEKILSIYSLNIFNFFDSYIIEEFYSDGLEILNVLFENKNFSWCKVDSNGIITQMNYTFESLLGYKSDELINKVYFWDVCSNSVQGSYIKAIYPFFKEMRPHPSPWLGPIQNKNKENINIKLYWRYCDPKSPEFSGIELVIFNF